jgi:hypothetical protein
MYVGKLVFAQIMDHLPLQIFHRCVARYQGAHKVKQFSCLDQYLCLAFAQLTWRESLRDIEACLRAQSSKLYHLGFRGNIARNTLANANTVRDWRIYADFAQNLNRDPTVSVPFGSGNVVPVNKFEKPDYNDEAVYIQKLNDWIVGDDRFSDPARSYFFYAFLHSDEVGEPLVET